MTSAHSPCSCWFPLWCRLQHCPAKAMEPCGCSALAVRRDRCRWSTEIWEIVPISPGGGEEMGADSEKEQDGKMYSYFYVALYPFHERIQVQQLDLCFTCCFSDALLRWQTGCWGCSNALHCKEPLFFLFNDFVGWYSPSYLQVSCGLFFSLDAAAELSFGQLRSEDRDTDLSRHALLGLPAT